MDICETTGVNLLGDGMYVPLKEMSVDLVACVSVLEYVPAPQRLVDEAFRVLKPGGLIYLSAPFVFPHHPPPDDLFRFSFQGLRKLAERFEPISVGSNRGPASTFCHLSVHFFAIALSFNSRRAYGAWLYIFTWALAWIKYLDRWIGHYQMAHVLFGSGLFVGKRPGVAETPLAQRPAEKGAVPSKRPSGIPPSA
jgi:SAM-dependent methyltransferase